MDKHDAQTPAVVGMPRTCDARLVTYGWHDQSHVNSHDAEMSAVNDIHITCDCQVMHK